MAHNGPADAPEPTLPQTEGRPQWGASAADRSIREVAIQLSAAVVGRGHSGAPLQRGGVQRSADAAG